MSSDSKIPTSVIERVMNFDAWREAWFAIARERGHVLKTDTDFGGGVDQFVTSGGYCNGPGCVNCGWTECMHCDWDAKRIPECPAAASNGGSNV